MITKTKKYTYILVDFPEAFKSSDLFFAFNKAALYLLMILNERFKYLLDTHNAKVLPELNQNL